MAESLDNLACSEAPKAGKTEPLATAVVLQGHQEYLEVMETPLHPAKQDTEEGKEDVRHIVNSSNCSSGRLSKIDHIKRSITSLQQKRVDDQKWMQIPPLVISIITTNDTKVGYEPGLSEWTSCCADLNHLAITAPGRVAEYCVVEEAGHSRIEPHCGLN